MGPENLRKYNFRNGRATGDGYVAWDEAGNGLVDRSRMNIGVLLGLGMGMECSILQYFRLQDFVAIPNVMHRKTQGIVNNEFFLFYIFLQNYSFRTKRIKTLAQF